jgi:putative solute:sodium symporter small subunit
MEPTTSPALSAQQRRYWLRTLILTAALLVLWLACTLLPALFAAELHNWRILGVSLPYYFFSQGTPVVFLLLIGIYVWAMNRLDQRFGVGERHTTRTSGSK